MKNQQKKFIHDLVAELLELPKNQVIWSNQNGIKPKKNFAKLRIYSHVPEAMAEQRKTGIPGEINIFTSWRCKLEVQYYCMTGNDAQGALINLVQDLERPSIVDQCFANRVAFFDTNPVQDLTALLDGTLWEARAAVDLSIRYNVVRRDAPGHIETIHIGGQFVAGQEGE